MFPGHLWWGGPGNKPSMVFSNTVDQKASEHCKSSDHKAQLRFEKYLLSLFIQITIKSAFLEEVWIALVMHKWLHAYSKECSNVICGWPLNPIWKHLLNFWYRMVGNFCEVFIFAFFASQEPFAKIKTAKILLPTCKANEPRFNPWPTSIQQPTKACQRVCLWRLSLK